MRACAIRSMPALSCMLHLPLELNPDPNNLPVLDPKDQFLLLDPSSSLGSFAMSHNASGSGTSTPTTIPHVTWLRKTEYLSRDSTNRSQAQAERCVLSQVPFV